MSAVPDWMGPRSPGPLRRLARPVAAAGLSVAFVTAIGLHSIRYVVRAEPGRITVETAGTSVAGPPAGPETVFFVKLAPQERYSTPQLLLVDRGSLVNGLEILRLLVFGSRGAGSGDGFTQRMGTTAAYVHFNPFRAALLLHQGDRDLRAEVNVPDDSVELLRDGVKVSQSPLHPPWIRLMAAPLVAALCLAGLLAVFLVPARGPGAAARPPADVPHAGWRMPLALFGAGALGVAAILFAVFSAVPGFGDEMNYLIQGKIFASGHLSVPQPALPEFFRVTWMDLFGRDGKIWGFHPPGNSALLALGWLAGAYWVTVPLVGGALLVVQYVLALELMGERKWALLHVAVVASSHYVLSLAASFMAHAPGFLFLSLFALAVVRFLRTERTRWLVLAALWSGLAFTVRPLTAVLAAAVPLAVVAARLRPRHARGAALAVAVGLAVSSTVFFYTLGITGQFDLPYAVKGPEVDQTLLVRLGKGWETHLTNLFRNTNEFAHRSHSFGALWNMAFFLVPLAVLWRSPWRRWLIPASATVAFFAVGHSLLHWYGWKWEPRMLYDVSFVFFLVSTAGLAALIGDGTGWGVWLRWGVAGAALLWALAVDVPARFRTEYRAYNDAPTGVMAAFRRGALRNALVLFGTEHAYSCYAPMNALTFDGDTVFAKSEGEVSDTRLVVRFPGKRVLFTNDGNALADRANFYRGDLRTLADELKRLGGPRPAVVLPWAAVAPTPLNEGLEADVFDPGLFLSALARGEGEGRVTAFVQGAVELAVLADASNQTTVPPATARFEEPVVFRRIGPRREGSGTTAGFWMTCWAGTEWKGQRLLQRIVSAPDPAPCPGEQRSMAFDARFTLRRETTFDFSIESDDGSGLFLDGKLVIDNDLKGTHGPERKSASITLSPGEHAFHLLYFNGPGDGLLSVTASLNRGTAVPVSVAAFVPDFHFTLDPAGPPSEAPVP